MARGGGSREGKEEEGAVQRTMEKRERERRKEKVVWRGAVEIGALAVRI